MKIGISVWAFPGDWSLFKIFETAKQAGFDGVEVALTENGEISLDSTEQDMALVKEQASIVGIKLYSVASGLYWSYSLTSDCDITRSKAKDIVKKQLDVAKWLGCDTVLVIPGGVGAEFVPDFQIVEYHVAYDRALDAMNELKSYAEERQIFIGVENVWNKFLLSPLEMRDFIDKINSPYVGAYFDVGNVICSGYPEHWIKILKNRIIKVRFKDFRKSAGAIDGFVDLLSGDVDYPAVITALEKEDYDGWVTAEVGFYNVYPEQSVCNTAKSMRRILELTKGFKK